MQRNMSLYGSVVVMLALAPPSFAQAHGTSPDGLARSVDYIADRGVSVVPSSDGGLMIVLETDFDHPMERDLRVILGKDGMFVPDADLGALAQMSGLQVFKAPPTVDVMQFDEVHLWDRDAGQVVGVVPLP